VPLDLLTGEILRQAGSDAVPEPFRPEVLRQYPEPPFAVLNAHLTAGDVPLSPFDLLCFDAFIKS